MEVSTGIGCRINCVYCPQSKIINAYTSRSNVLSLSFEMYRKCIDKIPLEVDIVFAGVAEPWLNKECTKMLMYAHEKGHRLSVYTTLVGMKLSDIEAFEMVPFKYFYVHLPSIEEYENINIDGEYLKLLAKIYRSSIKVRFECRGEKLHPKLKLVLGDAAILYPRLSTRAGNIPVKDIPFPEKKRGALGCLRNLHFNMLLPNGDVILCCMDYGMKHVLGNLLTEDYSSLFQGEVFLKVKKGMEDESLDILCRYCDILAYKANFLSKLMNPYIYLYQIKDFPSIKSLHGIAKR